jgi:NADH dehydrogenase [ubiquinone] 1 alpha subcomplex assembly factor 1
MTAGCRATPCRTCTSRTSLCTRRACVEQPSLDGDGVRARHGDLEFATARLSLGWKCAELPGDRRDSKVQLPVQSMSSPPSGRIVVDFRDPREAERWRPVDDRVMGGVSVSRLEATSSASSHFTGELSLENNGGFASVRAPLQGAARSCDTNTPLAGVRELVLRVRGDGKAYKLRLRSQDDLDGVNHEVRFETTAGVQTEHTFALTQFSPVWRGRPVSGVPPLDPAGVQDLGFMISDGQAGRFCLELFTLTAR